MQNEKDGRSMSTLQIDPWMVQAFAAVIFTIGLVGPLILLMCIELMLNAVNLSFVSYSHQLGDLAGQMSVFFIITVAAAESAVGLGLVIALFRTLKSVDTQDLQLLKE